MEEMSGRDKREHPRAPARGKILIAVKETVYPAHILDVSVQGMRVESNLKIQKGDVVSVAFFLGSSFISAKLELLYSSLMDGIGSGIPNLGLRFTKLDFDSRTLIEEYVLNYQSSLEELGIILRSNKLSADRIKELADRLGFDGCLEDLRTRVERELLYFET